jgi:type I restriction enzyme, S subunit
LSQFDKLPEGWVYTHLKDLGICTTIKINPADFPEEQFEVWSVPALSTGQPEILKGEEIGSSKQVVCENDVLLCKINPRINRVWKVGKKGKLRQIASTEWVVFRIPQNNSDYLVHFFREPKFRAALCADVTGVGGSLTRARPQEIQNLSIVLPPLNEQRRIVEKIEALTARSRKAREALEAIPALLDQFRQSVLAAAFRGDLTADWREQNPAVEPAENLLERIRAERRRRWEEAELEKMKAQGKLPKNDKWKEKYKEAHELEKSSDFLLSELPESWNWISADAFTAWITDGEHATPERSESGVFLLSARNVLDGRISLDKVDFVSEEVHKKLEERLKVLPGDVFLSCSGTVGRSCVVPAELRCSLVRSVAVLKPLLNMGEYLSLAIRSPYVQAQIEKKKTQTAQSNIFQGRIKTLAIPLAPIKEQERIIRVIADAFDFIKRMEQLVDESKENNDYLDQSILAKAFRGELVPQDPNDEPASVLLERIRAEREKLAGKKRAKSKG